MQPKQDAKQARIGPLDLSNIQGHHSSVPSDKAQQSNSEPPPAPKDHLSTANFSDRERYTDTITSQKQLSFRQKLEHGLVHFVRRGNEHAGPWVSKCLPAWYYRHNRLERWENGRIYELSGVRTFKRWLPTHGDRLRQKYDYHVVTARAISDASTVKRYIEGTKADEASHVLLGTGMAAASAYMGASGELGWMGMGLLAAANVAINIYPIFTQRYNRIRSERFLELSSRALERRQRRSAGPSYEQPGHQ